MGLLNALIESADRFEEELLPVGYAERDVTWVINIDPSGQHPAEVHKQSPRRTIQAPATPSDRTSSKVSATLLVDKVSYAVGLADAEKKGDANAIAVKEHGEFVNLTQLAAAECASVKPVADWLEDTAKVQAAVAQIQAKPNDLVVFEVGSQARATDDLEVQAFWSNYMSKRLGEEEQPCVVCGNTKPIARILPFKVSLPTCSVQISSFNSDAFCSGGATTKSGNNGAICYGCAGRATQVLNYLTDLDEGYSSGRHAVTLLRDEKKDSFRNQVAVFWTMRPIELQTEDGPKPGELLPRLTLEDTGLLPEDEMPAYASQLRELLERPLSKGAGDTALPANKFYLAVLSPNKSRLVVREWLEQDVEAVRKNVRRYLDALRILHPAGQYVGFPPLPAMLGALQSPVSNKNKNEEKPRLPQVEPDLMRKLIRCMFAGSPPPRTLLTRAVQCFRVPDPPAEGEQRRRQQFRRMALAAAMKLVLTYNNPSEQRIMEQRQSENDHLSDYKSRSPYLSGCLLALLEAIQSRPGNKVNTTLVDRFYGVASTAPASVFANLISTATKAHLPKLRREGKEWFTLRTGEGININDRMADTCAAINEAGGFKPFLTAEEQGQFALGFYGERAELKPPPRQRSGGQTSKSGNDNSTSHGDQS